MQLEGKEYIVDDGDVIEAACSAVILRCELLRASKDAGYGGLRPSFEARFARTSGDNGKAVTRG